MEQTLFRFKAILVVKLIGLIGRLSLTRLVGAEGVGLYQAAYSFYGLVVVFLTGGLPTALALATAKNADQGRKLFKIVTAGLLLIGGSLGILTFRYSDTIAHSLGYPELDFTIRCLSPALFIVPALSLVRGYLQGLQRFRGIAVSEVMEQFVRVAALLIAVPAFSSGGLGRAVGGSVLGTAAGAFAALLLLAVPLARRGRRRYALGSNPETEWRGALSLLLKTSLAIVATRLLIPLSDFTDMLIIPSRLKAAGYTTTEATEIYGVMTGMAVILAYVPTIFTASLSHTLTMSITVDWEQGRVAEFRRRMFAAFKAGWLWGLASGSFLFLFAPELSRLIFGTPEAERPIQYLAILPLLVGFREVSTSLLWAQNRKATPLYGLMIGIVFNIALIYGLASIPDFGYISISIGIVSTEAVLALWNLQALRAFGRHRRLLRPLLMDVPVFVLAALAVHGTRALAAESGMQALSPLPGAFLLAAFSALYLYVRCRKTFKLLG
ncbi:oligosaccharide flippase family protein [Cohnella xylanilytica]|uniref:Oligosaccharide flippase family protein n=1 Tax=Cohnella xylanilytica TaxID=557555 RepID=A0A841U0N2_9BACL|nr:oligosaccharide flippase family protein [Cohnella xylanilytica]MBB6691913.1 oligosaccharide flippase family protein [Cohnella xylanilytica]